MEKGELSLATTQIKQHDAPSDPFDLTEKALNSSKIAGDGQSW